MIHSIEGANGLWQGNDFANVVLVQVIQYKEIVSNCSTVKSENSQQVFILATRLTRHLDDLYTKTSKI